MALLDVYNLIVEDSNLLSRVTAQTMISAVAIRNEDSGTANHANRLAWANDALESRESLMAAAQNVYWYVIQNTSIQAAGAGATDNDIAFSVAADALPYVIPAA